MGLTFSAWKLQVCVGRRARLLPISLTCAVLLQDKALIVSMSVKRLCNWCISVATC